MQRAFYRGKGSATEMGRGSAFRTERMMTSPSEKRMNVSIKVVLKNDNVVDGSSSITAPKKNEMQT